METIDERTALCALNRVFGFLPAVGHALLEGFGSAAAVFRMPPERLQEALGKYRDLAPQLDGNILDWAREEMDRIFRGGFRFIGFGEEDYPGLLAECPDPPLGLYLNACSSPSEVFELRPCIAVVGTRDLSPYGRDWCRRLVHAMAGADAPPCIVSGLAFGADAVAHRTALECGLPTVGVMATGIERIYPWQHEDLAAQMVRTPGCAVVTDYPSGTSPVALNFVRRNRIIAGLARATVVIETKTKGGSLITAKYANDYDRDVYALPGRVEDPRSQGCNSLIRQRMADIITTPEDLAARLGLKPARGSRGTDVVEQAARRYGPDAPETRLVRLVRENRGASREELAALAGWPLHEVLRHTTTLECDGVLTTDLLGRCTFLP